jgi:hypothetical protein
MHRFWMAVDGEQQGNNSEAAWPRRSETKSTQRMRPHSVLRNKENAQHGHVADSKYTESLSDPAPLRRQRHAKRGTKLWNMEKYQMPDLEKSSSAHQSRRKLKATSMGGASGKRNGDQISWKNRWLVNCVKLLFEGLPNHNRQISIATGSQTFFVI